MGNEPGNWLRAKREARSLSLSAAAKAAGIGKATLSRWEAGLRQPSLPELEALLSALGLSPAEHRQVFGMLTAPRGLHRLRELEADRPPVGGDLLRAMRLRLRRSQADAAACVGVSQARLAKWERSEDWPAPERLHALCYALHATPQEITVLTCGNFTLAPAQEKPLSLDAFKERINAFRFAPDATNESLRDLRFLALEAQLWTLAQNDAETRFQLTVTRAYYARALADQRRFREAARYAELALAAPECRHIFRRELWLDAVIALARAEASGGRRSDLRAGAGVLQKHLNRTLSHGYRAWMQAEMAICLATVGESETALRLTRQACEAAKRSAPVEQRFRQRDLSRTLLQNGKPDEALPILTELQAAPSDGPDADAGQWLTGAEALLTAGAKTEARQWADEALRCITRHDLNGCRSRLAAIMTRL